MTDNTTDDAQSTDETRPESDSRRKMKEMDHAPPVGGAGRSFERKNEGRPPRTDGGRDQPAEEEEATDGEEATPDGGFSQKMKEMDHTPPVDGANRTFERGKDDDDDVAE